MLTRRLVVLVVAGVLLAALPFARESFGFPVFYLVFLTGVWFWAAEATSWSILSGYSGYFSFGQGAFVGVGAYSTAVLAGRHEWDYFATLPVAALLSTLLALAIGGLAFRLRSLRGEVFALLTLAVPFILASVARITPAIDGGQGIIVPVPDVPDAIGGFQEFVYLLGLAFATLAVGTALVMQGTRAGWALFAIQDAEDVAEGLGVPTFRNKMLAIGLTGLIGGLAGSVYALQIGFVTVEAVFGLGVPLFVIVMSVLGGRRHWLGPTLGALVIVTLQDRLSASGFEGWSMVVMGAVLATLIVLAPEGLVARLRQRPLLVGAASRSRWSCPRGSTSGRA
jgi:branched-chain amino acid transport system permease protein